MTDTEKIQAIRAKCVETGRENARLREIAAKLALAIRRDDDSKHDALAEWDDLSNVHGQVSRSDGGEDAQAAAVTTRRD